MSENRCECYYDAALHKQSTNCPLHDPYIRCEILEAENAQLRERIAELEQDVGEYRKQICTTKDGLYLPHEAPLTTNETINHLRGELEQLRWQYEQQHDQLAQRDAEIADLREEITSLTPNAILECEVVELRKDRERLEKVFTLPRVRFVGPTKTDPRWWVDIEHWVGAYWTRLADAFGATPREAIDAAITAAESKGEPS